MIGQTLGHYRILEKVAAGGMGVVYRARDEQLERDVAVKVLPSGTLNDDSSRRHFRREALALAKLNHPNIETVYEFGSQEGVDFLVMEYVPGRTLADKLADGPLPEKEVVGLAMQIAEALEEAHECGIVHRDLKPANIAITAKGQAKVLDFGLAKLLRPDEEVTTDHLTDSRAAAGTLPYMSPEQLSGERVDARADIYTVGAVLYEMTTSRRAFTGGLASQVIDAILHQAPVSPRALNARISPELERIILKCLDKDPAQRYQSAKELLVDFRRLAARSWVSVGAPAPRASRWRKVVVPTAIAALLVLAAVVVGLNVGGVRERLAGSARTPQIRSLAVLPLENRSRDPEQDYFADGMTDELITELGRISALKVISHTSIMRYKNTDRPVPEIAKSLHVDALVEGSVQRSGGRVKINARLIQARNDQEQQIWARSYERDLNDVLGLQREVAEAIASEIKVNLTAQEQVRLATTHSANFAAHDAYLKGRYHLQQGTEDQMREAKAYFEEAVRIDSNYAPAYAGLADYYWLTNELSPRVAMPKANEYVQKALALDDGLADAHLTLASVKFYGDWDWFAADKEFKRAIELSPSHAEAHRIYSDFLSEMGRHDQALAEIRTAQGLDPFSAATILDVGWAFYYAREYDRAIEQCRKVLDLDPHSMSARDCVGSAHLATAAYDQAIAEYGALVTSSGNDPLRLASLGCAYALAGRKPQAQKVIAQLNAASKIHYVPPYFLGVVHAALGDKDNAFSWLEKAYEDHDSYLVRLKVDPVMDPLRSDPRFGKLLHRMNL